MESQEVGVQKMAGEFWGSALCFGHFKSQKCYLDSGAPNKTIRIWNPPDAANVVMHACQRALPLVRPEVW